jgi:hypothetical protein
MKSDEGAMKAETDAHWVAADCGTIKPTTR